RDIAKALVPSLPASAPNDRPGLLHVPNKNYFGGVFLTQQAAPSLKLLVNREGFVPDSAYDRVVDIVRNGIDLTTRVRAMVTQRQRERNRDLRKAQRATQHDEDSQPESPSIIETLTEAEKFAADARRLTAAGNAAAATARLDTALQRIRQVTVASDDLA